MSAPPFPPPDDLPHVPPASVTVRPVRLEDGETLLAMTRALAAFHGHADAATLTVEDILRDGFGPDPCIWSWVAEAGGTAIGFVQASFGYAAWKGRRILVVNNLYVDAARRGGGAGLALMRAAAGFARAAGCLRVELHVARANPATAFYAALGFRAMPDDRCRIEGPALDRLIAGRPGSDAIPMPPTAATEGDRP